MGDFLLLSRSAYGAMIPGTNVRLPAYSKPRRGDVVVFRGTADPIDLVKRLLGMPGDTLSMVTGVLHVNGVAVNEPYVERRYPSNDVADPEMGGHSRFTSAGAVTGPALGCRYWAGCAGAGSAIGFADAVWLAQARSNAA